MIANAVLKYINGYVSIGISQFYFQPVIRSAPFDALGGIVFIIVAWSAYKKKY